MNFIDIVIWANYTHSLWGKHGHNRQFAEHEYHDHAKDDLGSSVAQASRALTLLKRLLNHGHEMLPRFCGHSNYNSFRRQLAAT